MQLHDIIIVGLGSHGSTCFNHLATNHKVLGIEQYESPHKKGSHNGETRIVRQFGYCNKEYQEMATKSIQFWQKLQDSTSEQVFVKTGGISFGKKTDGFYQECLGDLENPKFGRLNNYQLEQEYGINAAEVEWNSFDSNAGYVIPETVIRLQLERGLKKGGQIVNHTKYLKHEIQGDKILVYTDNLIYETKRLVLSLGIGLKYHRTLQLELQKQQVYFFADPLNCYGTLPVFASEIDDTIVYGFPTINNQLKIALHSVGPEVVYSELYDGTLNSQRSVSILTKFIDKYLPKLRQPKMIRTESCIYTNTVDRHFVIDFEEKNKNVIILSACSGHGFKFSILMGEIIEKMIRSQETEYKLFQLNRFHKPNF